MAGFGAVEARKTAGAVTVGCKPGAAKQQLVQPA